MITYCEIYAKSINPAIIFTLGIFVLFTLKSCSDKTGTEPNDEGIRLIFSEDFSDDNSDEKFDGYGSCVKDDDSETATIGGGCVQPAAIIEFTAEETADYFFDVRAKMNEENQSATLSLMKSGDYGGKAAQVRVNRLEFDDYESGKIRIEKGDDYVFEVVVGGIVGASVTLDDLKIYREK